MKEPRRPVRGKYGEPQLWDGLSVLFVVLARRYPAALTATDERGFRLSRTRAPRPLNQTQRAESVPEPVVSEYSVGHPWYRSGRGQ